MALAVASGPAHLTVQIISKSTSLYPNSVNYPHSLTTRPHCWNTCRMCLGIVSLELSRDDPEKVWMAAYFAPALQSYLHAEISLDSLK